MPNKPSRQSIYQKFSPYLGLAAPIVHQVHAVHHAETILIDALQNDTLHKQARRAEWSVQGLSESVSEPPEPRQKTREPRTGDGNELLERASVALASPIKTDFFQVLDRRPPK